MPSGFFRLAQDGVKDGLVIQGCDSYDLLSVSYDAAAISGRRHGLAVVGRQN